MEKSEENKKHQIQKHRAEMAWCFFYALLLTAAQEVQANTPLFPYEASVGAGMAYIQQHGAELVTNLAHGRLFNPGHPSCRCAVAYEEIPGTNLTAQQDDITINSTEENARA